MKFVNLLVCSLTLAPVLANAHPGHSDNALHLHLGLPAAVNSVDLRLTFGVLVLGVLHLALRASKRR